MATAREIAEQMRKKKQEEERKTSSMSARQAAEQIKKYNSISTDNVDQKYIDTFMNDANAFFTTVEKDYGGLGWSNASSAYDSRSTTWKDLNARADVVSAWLYKNRNNIDREYYDEFNRYLDSLRSDGSSVLDAFKGEADYYSNWATEDEYNEWNKYSFVPQSSDFAEKSKYNSTYRGGEKYNAFTNMYTDTGYDDVMYDYINGDEKASMIKAANDVSSNAAFAGVDKSERREMTEDEVAIFNYLYATEGSEAAYEYVDHITTGPVGLTARQRAAKTEQWSKYAEESPIAASVFSVLEAPMKGVSYIGQAADYLDDGQIDQNAGYNKFSYLNSAIRNQVASDVEKNWGGVGSFAYQTGMSMADFLFTTAITGGNSALSLGIMGTGAAADTVIYAKDRGLTDGQAFTLGTIAGAAEILTEKISLDALLDTTQLGKNAAGYILKNVLAEGSEEVESSLINLVADVLISKDKSEWQMAVNAYMASGMSDTEAFWHAVGDQALSLGLDFLGGAVSGGVMGTAGATINAIGNQTSGANLKRSGAENVDALVSMGKTFAEGTDVNRLANKVTADSSAYSVGRLLEKVGVSLADKNISDVSAALQEKGMSAEEAEKTAKWLYSAMEGETYNRRQRKAYETDDRIADVHRDLFTNEENSVNKRNAEYEALYALAQEARGVTAENTPSQAEAPAQQAEESPATENTPAEENVAESEFKASETGKTIYNGNEVKIKSVVSVESGDVKLQLESGEVVSARDVDFSNREEALLYEAVIHQGMDVDTANDFIQGFNVMKNAPVANPQSVSDYMAGFNEARTYGELGLPFEAYAKGGKDVHSLRGHQAQIAYNRGKINRANNAAAAKAERAAKPALTKDGRSKARNVYEGKGEIHVSEIKKSDVYKTLSDEQKAGVDGMIAMYKALGIDAYFFESPTDTKGQRQGKNGYFVPADNSVHIDLYAGFKGEGKILFTAPHELTHYIRANLPEKFKTFAEILFERYEENGTSVAQLISLKKKKLAENGRTKGLTVEQVNDLAYEEVVADACEAMMADGQVFAQISEKIQAKDKGLWNAIKKFFTDLVERISKACEKFAPDSLAGNLLADMLNDAKDLQSMWVDMLVEASEQNQVSTGSIRGNTDGAVVQNEFTAAIVKAASETGVLDSTRTEFEPLPKQTMSLSDGSGTLLYSIDGLTPAKIKGLTDKTVPGYTGRYVREFAMRNSGFTPVQIGHVNKFMDAMADFMKEAGVTYRFIGLDDVENAKLHYSYNPDGSIKSIVLSAMVKNGDYLVNFDLSSICKKRVAMSTLYDILAKRGDLDNGTVKLTPENIFAINKALKDAGYETACLGCFVESKRYNMMKWSEEFCKKWNAAVKKVNRNATYFGFGDASFTEASLTLEQVNKIDAAAQKFIKTTKTERLENALKQYKDREAKGLPLVVRKYKGKEYYNFSKAAKDRLMALENVDDEIKEKYAECDTRTLNMEDVEFLLTNGVLPGVALKNNQAIRELVNSGESYQYLLKPSDLLTDRGIAKLMELPNFYGVLYGHYGSGTPKLMQGFTPYNSEIALLPASKGKQTLAEYLYTIAGTRMQSFSDFQIQNIYDYLQMVADLAARKVPAHAYTKEISFAKLLGMTGIKVNLSVMFDIDTTVDTAHAGLTKYNPLVHKGEYAKIVHEDDQGKWVYNIGDYQTQKMFAEAYPDEAKRFLQSIGFADAVKIQSSPGYSANCGIIGVGYSDIGIIAMLNDRRIRYIIPYHASSMPAEIKLATHISTDCDYTDYQNNRKIDVIKDRNGKEVAWSIKEAYKRLGSGKAVFAELNEKIRTEGWVITTKKAQSGHGSFKLYEDLQQTKDPRQTTGNFMDWCAKNGTLPLFYQFSTHENYYKLIYDFNVYDCVTEEYAPQQAVTNTYPTMVDGQVLPGNVTDGGFDTEYFKGTIDKQMAFMNKYNSTLKEDLERLADNMEEGNYSLDEKAIVNGKLKLSNMVKNSDRDSSYLDAVNRGDMETAQRMVDEAANAAGYTIKAYHGTNADFTVFDKNRVGKGIDQYGAGFYFASNPDVTEGYGTKRYDTYLSIQKPIMLINKPGGKGKTLYDVRLTQTQAYKILKQHPLMYDSENSPLGDFYDKYWEVGPKEWMVRDLAKQYDSIGLLDGDVILYRYYPNELHEAIRGVLGYDGVQVYFDTDEMVDERNDYFYVAWFDNQIKSSDPVVRDDNGNVIPLSERFNSKNNDIRYSDRESDSDFNLDNYTIDELLSAFGDDIFEELFGGDDISIDDISEKLNVEPEKIEILFRRKGLGDSHIEENRTAVMKQKRINDEIEDSGAGRNPTYARKLITRISTSDFIDLTVSQSHIDRGRFDSEVEGDHGSTMSEFDYEKALQDSRSPYLCIDHSTGRVTGHNGRHRIRALEIAGIESVEIAVEFYDEDGTLIKYNAETIPDMAISSQFDTAIETHLSTIIPLNETHREEIERTYGEKAHENAGVKYSDRDPDSFSNRSLIANALESVAQNDIERNKLKEYKNKIALIESEQAKLAETKAKIKELSFAKGRRDTEAIKKLQFEANQSANRINTYDRQLLNLESTKALKGVLQREKQMAYKKAEREGKEALAKYREKAAKTQRELLTRYQESRKKGVEGRRKTEMRHKIKGVVNELNQYLLKGTKEKHVPIGLQAPVAEALAAVNMDTVGAEERLASIHKQLEKDPLNHDLLMRYRRIAEQGERMDEKLQALKNAYDEIVNSDDPMIANSHDEVISNSIANVIKVVGDTPLRDMSLTQLESVYDLYRMVLKTIRNANKAFKAAKGEEISTIANGVISELDAKRKSPKVMKGMEAIAAFDWNNLKPVYAFERIGSANFTKVFNAVRAGEDVWAIDMSEAQAFREAQYKKHNYESFDFDKQYDFVSSTGLKFTLRLDQIMSLYAYSKRGQQAKDHLKYGGFQFDGITEIKEKKGKVVNVTYQLKDTTAYKITDELLNQIIGVLDEVDGAKAFVDEMQEYLSSTMGEKGNDVSLELYDVKLFKEKNYFPLRVSHDFLARAREQAQGDVKIKNSGFTKETTPNARNPIVLSSFMDVWAGHVNEMSMYHAFTLPLEDFYRVYNYATPSDEKLDTISVVSSLRGAHRDGPVQYIDQLLKDLNGGARSDPRETLGKAMMANFKKAAVMASMSVVVQQPTAIVRAMAIVDAKYFAGKKVAKGKHSEMWSELKKYAPVAVIKEMGYFDTGMGKSSTEWLKGDKTWTDKVDDVVSWAPAYADEVTWVAIWNAVKRETLHTHKHLQPNSEAFLQSAGERFTEVIAKTQVYDSTLSRSANMRSKSAFMNMVTSFMAEPTTSINMLQNALLKGNKKQIARAFGAVYGSVILNSALVSLVYAMRDDDEDETYWEKYLPRLTTEIVDGINPLTYLPFVKDIWSIAQGFDIERADMSLMTDLFDSLQQMVKVASKDTSNIGEDELADHKKSVAEAIASIVDNISSLAGIPVKNVRRDIKGVINFFQTVTNGNKTTAQSLGNAIGGDLKDSVPVWGWFPDESKSDKLYDAIIKGDTAYVDRLKSGYKSDTAYQSAVRKALRDNDPRIKEAAAAVVSGDFDAYERIINAIEGEGHFTKKDIKAAIDSEVSAMTPDEETSESSSASKEVSIFDVEYVYRDVMDGDIVMAQAMREDIIQTKMANGSDRDEAEDSFNTSFTSYLKKQYDKGDVSGSEAESMLVSFVGKTEDEAASKVQYWTFKQDYPDYDLSESAVTKYYSDVASSGISVGVYYDYSKQSSKCKGTDADGDGRADSGTKKAEVMAVINSLPLTSAQKDALYYLNGWSASTIWQAPWH